MLTSLTETTEFGASVQAGGRMFTGEALLVSAATVTLTVFALTVSMPVAAAGVFGTPSARSWHIFAESSKKGAGNTNQPIRWGLVSIYTGKPNWQEC